MARKLNHPRIKQKEIGMTAYDPRRASDYEAVGVPVPPDLSKPPPPADPPNPTVKPETPNPTVKPEMGRSSDTQSTSLVSKGPHAFPRCTAHAKTTGQQCGNRPCIGATVCRMHGGAAGQVRAAAARRMTLQAVEAEAASVLAFHGIAGVLNPLEEVARLTAETRATLDALAGRVNALDVIRYSASGSGTEQTRAEMVLLGQYQDRLARLLQDMMRWDFDNRRLLLQEHLAKATGALLGKFMDELMDSLRDELVKVGADALEDTFPKVWKDAIGRLFPAAFRDLGKRVGGAG